MLVVPFPVERAGLRSIIESSSRHSVVAEETLGESAVRVASQVAPDVAVIDYAISDTTGLGLAGMLTRKHPHISILLYCDSTNEELVIGALRAGVRGFVLKSLASSHLVPALDALSDHRPYWDDAIEDELFDRIMGGPPRGPDCLTPRESQVMALLANSCSTKTIAFVLDITPKTVETFRTSLRRKLRLRSTADIVRYAIDHGIIEA